MLSQVKALSALTTTDGVPAWRIPLDMFALGVGACGVRVALASANTAVRPYWSLPLLRTMDSMFQVGLETSATALLWWRQTAVQSH